MKIKRDNLKRLASLSILGAGALGAAEGTTPLRALKWRAVALFVLRGL